MVKCLSHVTVKVEERTLGRSGSNSGEDGDNGSDGEKWFSLILGTVEVGKKEEKEVELDQRSSGRFPSITFHLLDRW